MGRLEAFLAQLGTDSAILHRPENMRWLSGYTGEGCLFVGGEDRVLLTDSRYTEQARRQAADWTVREVSRGSDYPIVLGELARGREASRVRVETDYLTYDAWQALSEAMQGAALVPMGGILEELREIKDDTELAAIRRAGAIASDAFERILPRIRAGMTERQVQRMLEFEMLELGSEGAAFETIAAAGPNGALPHATPSDRPIERGELLTLDFGATVDGYRSDMTRTVGIGKVSQVLRDMYEAVREAQQLGVDALVVGARCDAVDQAVRDCVFARYPGGFGHSVGHGVGLQIHERPWLSGRCDTALRPGHVVTVEPGVYIPGLGGCRIEDTVIITADGPSNIIAAPKRLIEL